MSFLGHHVCRRCLVLYPTVVGTAVIATLAAMAASRPEPLSPLNPLASDTAASGRVDSLTFLLATVPLIWILLAPMVVEWTLEHAGRIEYSPARQVLLSVSAGIGGGLAFAVHIQDPFNLRATLPVAATVTACLLSTVLTRRQRRQDVSRSDETKQRVTSRDDSWLDRHEAEEAERLERLTELLDRQVSQQRVASSFDSHS